MRRAGSPQKVFIYYMNLLKRQGKETEEDSVVTKERMFVST